MVWTFSTAQLPKVVRAWCALYILTWTRCLRHDSAQLFISHLANWLLAPAWKSTVFPDFPTFSCTWIFFLLEFSHPLPLHLPLLFSSLTLPIYAFHLSILSEVWPINFGYIRFYFISDCIHVCYTYVYCAYTYTYTCLHVFFLQWVGTTSGLGIYLEVATMPLGSAKALAPHVCVDDG